MIRLMALCVLLLPLPLAAEDLESIRKDSSPIRRHERALSFMDGQFKEAQRLQREGARPEKVLGCLNQMAGAAEYSLEALRETGKPVSKLTKQYKQGDLRTRDLLRKVEGFIPALDYDDRTVAEKTKLRIQVVAEEYLHGVMSKK